MCKRNKYNNLQTSDIDCKIVILGQQSTDCAVGGRGFDLGSSRLPAGRKAEVEMNNSEKRFHHEGEGRTIPETDEDSETDEAQEVNEQKEGRGSNSLSDKERITNNLEQVITKENSEKSPFAHHNNNQLIGIQIPPIPIQYGTPPGPEEIAHIVDDLVRIPEIMAYFRNKLREIADKKYLANLSNELYQAKLADIKNNERLRDKEAGPPDEGWYWHTGLRDQHEWDEHEFLQRIKVTGWMPPSIVEPIGEPDSLGSGIITGPLSAKRSVLLRDGCWLLALCHDYYSFGIRPAIIDEKFAKDNPAIAIWRVNEKNSIYKSVIRNYENRIYSLMKDIYYDLTRLAKQTTFSESGREVLLKSKHPEEKLKTEKMEKQGKKEAKKKKRPTAAEMENRNEAVAMVAVKFLAAHDRLPTVDEIVTKTKLSRNQIYATNAYKEGKIAKKSAKLTTECTGCSTTTTEQFGQRSIEHSRANRRSKSEQDELDVLIDQQKKDYDSKYTS